MQYGVNVKHQEYFADSPSSGMDPASRDEWAELRIKLICITISSMFLNSSPVHILLGFQTYSFCISFKPYRQLLSTYYPI